MKTICASLTALSILASAAWAEGHGGWRSIAEESSVAFGSVKKDVVGEVHHFTSVSGSVSETGDVQVEIDLTSLETYIDIRNERMTEHVFKGTPTATLTGTAEMEDLTDLAIGETAISYFEGTLSLAGIEADIDADMFVARLGEDRILVTTADFIMLSTEDLGIEAGIDKLMALAELPGITRVTPVSIRMVLER